MPPTRWPSPSATPPGPAPAPRWRSPGDRVASRPCERDPCRRHRARRGRRRLPRGRDRLGAGVGAPWAGAIVLEGGGAGSPVPAPASAVRRAGDADGGEITVHTHLHVREDTLQLYGFASTAERSLFELLLGVSGVGPKAA